MTGDRERAETGEYVETITNEVVLDALDELIREQGERVVTAREVAEVAGFSRDGVLKRLNRLHEQSDVHRKKVGGRSVVWWVEE